MEESPLYYIFVIIISLGITIAITTLFSIMDNFVRSGNLIMGLLMIPIYIAGVFLLFMGGLIITQVD